MAGLEITLEEPGDDYELNCILMKIAGEMTADNLDNMKYLLRGSYLF